MAPPSALDDAAMRARTTPRGQRPRHSCVALVSQAQPHARTHATHACARARAHTHSAWAEGGAERGPDDNFLALIPSMHWMHHVKRHRRRKPANLTRVLGVARYLCVCVCVCVCERERERERECVCVCVCVHVCACVCLCMRACVFMCTCVCACLSFSLSVHIYLDRWIERERASLRGELGGWVEPGRHAM